MRGRSVVVIGFSGSLVLGFAGYGFVGSWVRGLCFAPPSYLFRTLKVRP